MVVCFADSKEKIKNVSDENKGIAVLNLCFKKCSECDVLDTIAEKHNKEKEIPLIKIELEQAK